MDIDYDPAKDEINRFKHRLPLAFGKRLLEAVGTVVAPTFRSGDEEERWKAVGVIEDKLYTAVFVWRGEVARMISVRRSNASEQRRYDSDTGRS